MSSSGLTADLHVHSKYSKRPSQWILQKIDCPECFSDPKRIYGLAQDRGMDLVTITDHNSIAGSLEIAHLPGTFISEEVTSYFPQDGCKIHVLTLDISQEQHRDIQHLRQNIFDLVPYLRDQGIVHIVAHPFYDMNNRLHIEHFEQMLLLFELFELNGSRDKVQNHILEQILAALTAKDIELLADKHDLQPGDERPWIKTLTAGSDDHSSLNIARAYTRVPGAAGVQGFLQGLRQGRAEPHSQPASARTMGHNLYAIAYQFYKAKFNLDRFVQKDELLQFVDCALTGNTGNNKGFWNWLYDYLGTKRGGWSFFKPGGSDMTSMIHKEGRAILNNNPHLLDMIHDPDRSFQDREDDWFNFVREASDRLIKNFSQTLVESASQARLFNIFATIGSGGSVYALLAPYFLAFGLYSKDRSLAQACLERLKHAPLVTRSQSPKVALFTDTFDQCNGVALTLQHQALLAKDLHKNLHILTCGSKMAMDKQVDFAPFGRIEVPEYTELDLACPSFLEILDFCAENDFTHIHTSTPGPMGLAALAAARILHLPIYGTYHTAFPQYAAQLTGDEDMEALMWKLMTWYYNQLDTVYVPSRATGEELTAHGIQPDKIKLYPRGIETDRFHPQHTNGFWEKRFGLQRDRVKLLYVGRISKEKNLEILAQAYAKISKARNDIQLIIVGDGPFLNQMQDDLSGTRAVFAGTLTGLDLSQAYASSDIFVFPSTTDTFGNVVLEAQASGLPVIVTDQGGPQENLIPDQTGLIVPALDAQALQKAILTLADDPQRLQKMKIQARGYMQGRSTQEAFVRSWEMYGDGQKCSGFSVQCSAPPLAAEFIR
ncbi:MAG: glycosyltransferase [Desulfovermiculus sp.]|nr:glycosyltransferase [Desulfovermiculus sp.]